MVNPDLLEILRCPACVQEKEGLLRLVKDSWLICSECGRKYPIVEDIPVMLISEAEKWQSTPESKLPIPPPRPD
ncbi:MAG: Trm112 family protein [Anaerolineaceae bacterium]